MNEGLIIIPACNEEASIKNVIRDIKKLNVPVDILVINDGSRDNTLEIVMKEDIKVISHLHNLGYGAALQTGYIYAASKKYKYIIQFDGDGQHDPNDIVTAISLIEKEDAFIVTGSRFMIKKAYKQSALKVFAMKILRAIIKVATKTTITDPTSGFKALSRQTYTYFSKSGNFPPDYPDVDIIIKMLILKYKIVEFPITVKKREYGESMHSGLKPVVYLFKVTLSIIIVLLRERIMKEGDVIHE
ncbi:MAG: glycosyltransferase family 2 protein [Clostridia bacterium]